MEETVRYGFTEEYVYMEYMREMSCNLSHDLGDHRSRRWSTSNAQTKYLFRFRNFVVFLRVDQIHHLPSQLIQPFGDIMSRQKFENRMEGSNVASASGEAKEVRIPVCK